MSDSLLIIDDSLTMRRIIKRTIRISGINFSKTREAESGERGSALLSQRPVDVVLCNVFTHKFQLTGLDPFNVRVVFPSFV